MIQEKVHSGLQRAEAVSEILSEVRERYFKEHSCQNENFDL